MARTPRTPRTLLSTLLGLFLLLAATLAPTLPAHASLFGGVQGIVHDPQHRPIPNATVTLLPLHAANRQTTHTAPDGSFSFPAVPLGDYTLSATHAGFATVQQPVTVASGTIPELHLLLPIATAQTSTLVNARQLSPDSATPTTLIRQQQIEQTPGADQTDSLAMITDFVPGAYMTHDMLHMRGGHQVSFLIDGVNIPNTNIASNLGPQIDPKDIAYLQVDRGSYNASLGDRTYGIFDVVPQDGFSRNNSGEAVFSAGSFLHTDDQLNLGSHTRRFAYYSSLEGNRSDYGLSTPVGSVLHDASNGFGGFTSLLFNKTPHSSTRSDQLRFVAQARQDFFQIPYDPQPDSLENQQYDSSGLRDTQRETDALSAFTWVHTFSPTTLFTLSPFWHYNSANYTPSLQDNPVATTSDRTSIYSGLQASAGTQFAHNIVQAGLYSFGQHDSDRFANVFNDASFPNFALNAGVAGGLVEEWISDSYKPFSYVTVLAGLRASQFRSTISDTETDPRLGLAIEVPKLHWVFRGFYGRFYQAPPLVSTAGPLVNYANATNTSLIPLHGERDEEHQFGVQIPLPGLGHGWGHGWLLDADTFQTRANNFLDHSNIGESSIYIPVTVDGALIQAWELTLNSPTLPHDGHAHLAYSNQLAQQRGAITGGLVCYPISSAECDVAPGYTPLDHDQRNTLNFGYSSALPFHSYASTNVYYGSGFTNGDPDAQYPGNYLPQHTTFDLAAGTTLGSLKGLQGLGENTALSVTATNVTNRRVLLDNSLTFGGFHYNDPRRIYAELRYHFHY
jgi:hypothetical protein